MHMAYKVYALYCFIYPSTQAIHFQHVKSIAGLRIANFVFLELHFTLNLAHSAPFEGPSKYICLAEYICCIVIFTETPWQSIYEVTTLQNHCRVQLHLTLGFSLFVPPRRHNS